MLKRRVAKSRDNLKRLSKSRSRDEENDDNPPPPPPRQGRNNQPSSTQGRSRSKSASTEEQQAFQPQQQQQQQFEEQGRSSRQQQQQDQTQTLYKNQQVNNTRSITSTTNDSVVNSSPPSTPTKIHRQKQASDRRSQQIMAGSSSVNSKLATIQRVYGPTANAYTDVLKVSPTATQGEIREAFFCLRYDIYQKLDATSNGPTSGNALTSDERKVVEAQMDAITGAFHILSDGERRKAYDATLNGTSSSSAASVSNNDDDALNTSIDTTATDDMGFPIPEGSPGARGSRSEQQQVKSNNNSSPAKLSPSKADNKNNAAHLPIGQRRSVFRRRAERRANSAAGGMNEARRPVAKDVTGGLNARVRRSGAAAEQQPIESQDSIFSVGPGSLRSGGSSGGRKSPMWTDFGNNGMGNTNNNSNNAGEQNEEPSLPAGVNNLNAREQMLYKNQMYLSQQKQQQEQGSFGSSQQRSSRVGSRYDTVERGDKYAEDNMGQEPLTSPTGVEDFDQNDKWSSSRRSKKQGGSHKHGNRTSPETATDSNMTEDEEDGPMCRMTEDASTAVTSMTPKTDGFEVDDDGTATQTSSVYDDDTQTYDDATSYADETTLGETVDDNTTIGESTWASYDDDGTSYATGNEDPYYNNNDGAGGKYSPGHKKGKKPEPILKSGLNKGLSRSQSDSGNKRVTIHSHRGKGEADDDFSLFEGAMCPTIPSFTAIQEEVNGTYKDFQMALHQVSNAFVISPDDIDRMADKIRDAKIELGENYARQVKDRQLGNSANQGDESGGGKGHKQRTLSV